MRYRVLALDYDGTLADDGRVSDQTIEAIKRLKQSGRKLMLVTGRELPDLKSIFPNLDIFDRVVAENGGVLYRPDTQEEMILADPPPQELVAFLKREKVVPLSVGRVIVACSKPAEKKAVKAIRDLGLEHHIIFNKDSVMILPSGVNKATGLSRALEGMGFSAHNTVGIGDAENDLAFLSACECSVAVANALDSVRKRADISTSQPNGAGVREIIEQLIKDDVPTAIMERHRIQLGTASDGSPVMVDPYGTNILLCGTSGGGKSTLAMGFLERAAAAGYQFCVIDPEGDYDGFDGATTLGSPDHPPEIDAVAEFFKKPSANLILNLSAIAVKDRPDFFSHLYIRLQELRTRFGRPHWILMDEIHHMMPAERNSAHLIPKESEGLFLITVHPNHVSPSLLSSVNTILSLGQSPENGFRAYAEAVSETAAVPAVGPLEKNEVWMWRRFGSRVPVKFRVEPPHSKKLRHRRKYAEGEMEEERVFYFRGPGNKMNLRVQNLQIFIHLAEGVDDATWNHHLRRGDYSRWFRDGVKNNDLAGKAADIEKESIPPKESRRKIIEAIKERYTAPA